MWIKRDSLLTRLGSPGASCPRYSPAGRGNPKFEARNSKQIENSGLIVSDFGFRYSNFLVLRTRFAVNWRNRNINRLDIAYAYRPRLSSRLTPRRRTLRGNPWIFGLGDSHPHLATHTGILTSNRSTRLYSRDSPQLEHSPTAPRAALGNPKFEARNSKQIQNSKSKCSKPFMCFEFW